MAAFKFISFDEIEKLLDVLLHFIENDNKKAMEKIDKIAQEYKEKYDDYLKDLAVIGQTGKIPFNKTLEEDLKKMNSNSAFAVK